MKLLYLSCHCVLEYDEIKLFKELGIDVFAHGVYKNPNEPGDPKRPAIRGEVDPHLLDLAEKCEKEELSRELIEQFDAVMVMHRPDWVMNNWERMKDKAVIWRSIGQSTIDVERIILQARRKGLKIVRYSPRERTIPGYVGEDVMIRFYKDPDEFGPYTGEIKQVFNISQSFKQRVDFCNFNIFKEIVKDLPWKVAGSENEALGDHWIGEVDYKRLRSELRKSRVYVYTGTYPAAYTLNFIEAWMTGIPIVALGPGLGNSPFELGQSTYEIPDLVEDGSDGYFSDNIGELRTIVKGLLDDPDLGEQVGLAGRARAIQFFGKDKIKKEWKEFFERL